MRLDRIITAGRDLERESFVFSTSRQSGLRKFSDLNRRRARCLTQRREGIEHFTRDQASNRNTITN